MALPLTISSTPLTTIKPHPKNARSHDESNIQAIMRSLHSFGQRTPIVIGQSKYILKGCGTWEAARRLGWATIQTVTSIGLTPAQELAYSLADNKTSDLSTFNKEGLADILKYLESTKIDMDSTGFAEFERETLLKPVNRGGAHGEATPGDFVSIAFEPEHMAVIDAAVSLATETGLIPDIRTRYPDALCALCAKFLEHNGADLNANNMAIQPPPITKKQPPPIRKNG